MPLPDASFHALHAAPDTSGGGVLVRVATRGAAPLRVDLRTEPDHEERLTPFVLVGTRGPWRHYEAPLVSVTHDDVTRYAIRFLFPTQQAWLAQDGLHELMPLTDVHFRYRPGYRGAAWVWEQVVYQVFPDRFRDGDPTNNVRSGAYHYGGQPVVARGWEELPTRAHGPREFFGGDLDGIRDALPYLEDLGASMLYLNPIFTSPSSHKYDTVDYDHVDPHLGGDEAFLRLLEALRARGMRVVLDAVVNHTSERHPWFGKGAGDLHGPVEAAGAAAPGDLGAAATPPGAYHGPHSPTRDHYVFEDPADPESYGGWAGVRSLPVLDFASPGVRDKVYEGSGAILRRWLRPPWSIDGWRLDVAHMLGEGPGARRNHDHHRAIRAAVKADRPDAYLLGEHFFEALPWLQGDEEDGAMNYDGFLRPMLAFWAGIDFRGSPLPLDAAGLDAWMTRVRARLPFEIQLSQLNLLDSHDVPRFLTRVGGDVSTLAAAAHALFAYPGVPSIYYGDEIGLEGGEDPDCRRPFPWDEGRWHRALRETYRALAHLRRRAPPLQRGGYGTLHAQGDVFAFARTLDGDSVITIVHRGARPCAVTLPTWATGVDGTWTDALRGTRVGSGDHVTLALPPRSGTTLVSHEGWLGAHP